MPNASALIAHRRRTVTAAALSAALLLLVLTVALAVRFGPSIGRGDRPTGSAASATAAIPAAARAEVSAALGAAQPAFHVHATTRGDLAASNGAQGLTARFAAAGVTVSKAALDLHLSLRSVGFGDVTRGGEATTAGPTAYSNRATYARGSLSEWYANGPAGLEQGFTLKHAPAAPAGRAGAPLTLDLALAANARPRLAANGQSLTLRRGDAELRYGSLLTTDASGHALRTWLELKGGHVLIRVAAAKARYPLTIDPLVQAGSKLTAGDELGEGLLGTSVALSADGSTLLVGGPRDANADRGAAWVFVREGSSWVQQGSKLTGAEPPKDEGEEEQCAEESPEEAGECAFGSSVALSADGNTALIGEPSATARPGSAWVFTRSGTAWTSSTVLPGEGVSVGGRFGKSVALSADGQTALIGDPSASSQRGNALVFKQGVAGWVLNATLADAELSRMAHFGRSVALSADGQTALIGGPSDTGYTGAAWVFTHGASSWSQQPGKLTGGGESGEARFGKSVALSGDGTTALIGGLNDAEGRGAVWAFTRSGSSFTQQGEKITGVAEREPRFGFSVALSGDGAIGLVGSPRAETTGLVTVLTRSGSSWSAAGEQLAGSGEVGKGWLGAAVAVSQDGTVVGVGAPHDSARTGAAWVFTGSPGVTLPPPTVTNVQPGAGEAGDTVKVRGTNFTGAEAVFFDSQPATFVVKSALVIEAVAPEGLSGTVDVTVKTPAGVSPVNRPADEFRFATGKGKNPLPEEGGGSTTGGGTSSTQTTTTSDSGAKIASGGVLGTTSSGGACVLSLRNKRLAVTGSRTVALRLQRTGAGSCSGKLTLSFNRAKR
ncbi:MAG TPA: IPT/TIG domain-containing protein, partial [Solirubrobacteraceae bacterium]